MNIENSIFITHADPICDAIIRADRKSSRGRFCTVLAVK